MSETYKCCIKKDKQIAELKAENERLEESKEPLRRNWADAENRCIALRKALDIAVKHIKYNTIDSPAKAYSLLVHSL